MAIYKTNKGVGRNALVKGMTKSYLMFFVISIFLGYVTYLIVDDDQTTWMGFLAGGAVVGVGAAICIYLSGKFGEKGLMQYRASKNVHKYIHNRSRLKNILIVKN